MICFPSHSLSLHTFVIVAAGRDVVMLIARGSVGQDPWGRPQREWGDAQEKSSQTGRHRIGQDTGHSTLNGTELNVTEPNQDQTRTKADRTEAYRTEHRPVECIKCWPKLQPAHISHESVCQVKSPSPLIPHNNNNDNPPCGAHSVCVLTMTKC